MPADARADVRVGDTGGLHDGTYVTDRRKSQHRDPRGSPTSHPQIHRDPSSRHGRGFFWPICEPRAEYIPLHASCDLNTYSRLRSVSVVSFGTWYVPRPARSGDGVAMPKQWSPLATLPDVTQRLTDALKVGLLLRGGIEVVLHVVTELVFGPILKGGGEPVRVGVSEQVGRERRRDASRDTGYVRSCAVGRSRRRISRSDARGST